MTDPYEQREGERRKDRERAARRWKRLTMVPVLLLVPTLIAWWGVRACGHDLFGWGKDYRTCSLSETEAWIDAGADWMFWACSTGLILGLVRALWTVREVDEPGSPK